MKYIFIVLGVLVLWGIYIFNRFISFRNRVGEAWSDIEVQLKRRYDLIPNLISTVKGYAAHESGVFEKVTAARTAAMNASNTHDKLEKENMLSGALKSLFAVAENYPDLKANQNFLSLQSDLTDTENKIQASRRFYNGNVRDYNTKIQVFPTNFIASMLGYKICGENLDLSIVITDIAVVEAAGSLNFVFRVSKIALQAQKILIGFQVRIVFCDCEQRFESAGKHVFFFQFVVRI